MPFVSTEIARFVRPLRRVFEKSDEADISAGNAAISMTYGRKALLEMPPGRIIIPVIRESPGTPMTTKLTPTPLRHQVRSAITEVHAAHRKGRPYGRMVLTDGVARVTVEDVGHTATDESPPNPWEQETHDAP